MSKHRSLSGWDLAKNGPYRWTYERQMSDGAIIRFHVSQNDVMKAGSIVGMMALMEEQAAAAIKKWENEQGQSEATS